MLSLCRLYEDMMKNTLNLEVQLLLKQGQVEVACGQFIPDYSDSILVHRGVVEDLNGTIRVSYYKVLAKLYTQECGCTPNTSCSYLP